MMFESEQTEIYDIIYDLFCLVAKTSLLPNSTFWLLYVR